MKNGLRFKPSKNALCPCNSGETYKKCCMGTLSEEQEEYYWLLQKEKIIKDKIIHRQDPEIRGRISSYLQVYLNDINQGGELNKDKRMLFFDWLFYEAGSNEGEKFLSWLAKNFRRIFDPLELEIMSQWGEKTQMGVYEQLMVDGNNWKIQVKEAISGKTYTITERLGTKVLAKWDIVFGRISEIFGQHYYSGFSQKIPRLELRELKQFIHAQFEAAQKETQLTYEAFMNKKGLSLMYSFAAREHTFLNRLGENLEMCEAKYKISSGVEGLIDWFASLPKDFKILEVTQKSGKIKAEVTILSKDRESDKKIEKPFVLSSDVVDEDGNVTKSIGSINIEDDKMTLFSASDSVFRKTQERLKAKFGGKIVLVKEEITNVNDKKFQEKLGKIKEKKDKPLSDELLSIARKHLEKYYVEWCDQKIPALGDITPREAIKTEEGRKMVNELLVDFENFELNKKLSTEANVGVEKIIRKELNFYEKSKS